MPRKASTCGISPSLVHLGRQTYGSRGITVGRTCLLEHSVDIPLIPLIHLIHLIPLVSVGKHRGETRGKPGGIRGIR
jgi:hypothetical protein